MLLKEGLDGVLESQLSVKLLVISQYQLILICLCGKEIKISQFADDINIFYDDIISVQKRV